MKSLTNISIYLSCIFLNFCAVYNKKDIYLVEKPVNFQFKAGARIVLSSLDTVINLDEKAVVSLEDKSMIPFYDHSSHGMTFVSNKSSVKNLDSLINMGFLIFDNCGARDTVHLSELPMSKKEKSITIYSLGKVFSCE
jgi:hypothetical protein